MPSLSSSSTPESQQRDRLLRVLADITFMIFFEGHMVAPKIPRLAATFRDSAKKPAFSSLSID